MSCTLAVPLGPSLTAEEAAAIYAQGPEAVIFALLEMAKRLGQAESQRAAVSSPSTPSGMRPIYQKSPTKTRGKKPPGRKVGHPGVRRAPPTRIDEHKDHRAKECPQCGGHLQKCAETRTRYTEDIPAGITPIVTEHTIHRDWCPCCKKLVEPKIPDALPGSTVGNNVLALSAWLHYGLGNTLSQVVEVFNYHLQFPLTPGGLVQQWFRLEEVLFPWYESIQQQALQSAVLHADETGWRVNGKGHWLWCFATDRLTYYMIDRRRGRPALAKFFKDEFAGTLVTDFWGAYNAIVCGARQTCLAHLLRDMEFVEQYKYPSLEWAPFAKKLRRLIGDGIRLRRQNDSQSLDAASYISRRDRLETRLTEIIETSWEDGNARRLIKR
ncbi:MAG: IS66 family transposase, partial [Nitrosospira sp.]